MALIQRGYKPIGDASFNAASTQATEEQLRDQAHAVGAHVVLVSSKYSHTITGAIPLTIPTTTTSYTSGTATAYGTGGMVTAYGTGTTTTYGSQTTMIPYSVPRSDFSAIFFAKFKTRVGIVTEPIDDETKKRLQTNSGAKVIVVIEGSSAFQADVLPSDIVLEVAGDLIQSAENFNQLVQKYEGQTVQFRLDRGGQLIDKQIEIRKIQNNQIETNNQNLRQPSTTPTTSSNSNSEASDWAAKSLQSLQSKQWAEAIRTATIAISLDPASTDPYINRGWAYAEKGLYDKAIEDCNAALKINPQLPSAINNRGLAYLRMGQKENAIRDYKQACEMGLDIACNNFKDLVGYLPAEEVPVLLKDTEKAFSVGDFNGVISLSSKVISLQPNNAEAYSNKCGAEASLVILKEGQESCQKAIKLDPNFSMAYNNLGFVFEQEKNIAEASLYYEMSCNLGNDRGCQNQRRLAAAK